MKSQSINYLLQDFPKKRRQNRSYILSMKILQSIFNSIIFNKLRNSILVNRRKNEISTSSTMKLSGEKVTDDFIKFLFDRHLFRTIFSKYFQVCVLRIRLMTNLCIRTRNDQIEDEKLHNRTGDLSNLHIHEDSQYKKLTDYSRDISVKIQYDLCLQFFWRIFEFINTSYYDRSTSRRQN